MSAAVNILPSASAAPTAAVGVFDSGLGGLSILSELTRILPAENFLYFADTLHIPYGPRPLAEVRGFAVAIAGALIKAPCKIVVVACNTASAAALRHLREVYPGTRFVGMEPAVKPAAQGSRTGIVGVMATSATFHGELFESVVTRFAEGVAVIRQPCPGLAEFIENHPPDHPALRSMLAKFVLPLIERGADAVVLGCTHYALVKNVIQDVAGPGCRVIDPAPAVARRTADVLTRAGLLSPAAATGKEGNVRFVASGDAAAFALAARPHWGGEVRAEGSAFNWLPAGAEGGGGIWRESRESV